MNKTTKCFLLSFLIASSSINSMEFISSIPLDSFKSFIKEHPVFALLLSSVTGIGLYGLYKYKSSQKSITITHEVTPNKPENVRWVKTNDGKVIKLHANFANNVLHIDERIEREKKIRILESFCKYFLKRKSGEAIQLKLEDIIPDNSQNNPFNIPCSVEELRLVLEATREINNHQSLLQFTESELDILNNVATKLNIPLISSMISNIRFFTLSPENISEVDLNVLLPLLRNSKIDEKTTVRFFGIKNLSNAGLFKDIMSLYIQPQVFTKKEFEEKHKDNSSQKKMLNVWFSIDGDQNSILDSWSPKKEAQYKVLFYTPDEKYYITDHLTIKPDRLHTYRVYSSATDKLIEALPSKENSPYPILFPRSNKLVYCIQEEVESFNYRSRYFIYDIEQQKRIALPQELPLFTTITITPDENILACAAAEGVYIMNITNTENIIYKHIPHPFPKCLAFSPNGLHLAFGCTRQDFYRDALGATVELCTIEDIDWNSNEIIVQSKKIADGIECFNIKFAHDTMIIVDNETGRFQHKDIAIDISGETIRVEELPSRNTHGNDDGEVNIYETFQAKNRKISDFSAIVSNKQLSIYSPSYKTLFSQKMDMTYRDSLIVSSNRKYWATNHTFNLLLRNDDNTFCGIETGLKGNCLRLNDDGSLWLATQNSINFYNPQQECYMTFDCKPFYRFNPKIKEKENQIICYHYDQYDTGDTVYHESKMIKEGCITRWQIPSQEETKTIYSIIDNLTPLQYIFIKDMCGRKQQEKITLRKDSLHEKIFASFTDSRKIVSDYLRILPS